MALETKLRWALYLGENEHLSLKEDLLEYSNHEDVQEEEMVVFYLPQLLQEVYYVDLLSRNANLETGIFRGHDSVYDYLRIFHGRLVELLQLSYKHLLDNQYLDDHNLGRLSALSGMRVGQYVENNLQEPFRSRDAAYMIFNMLPNQYKYHLPHDARRNIIASYEKFEKYWNKGMELLCQLQDDIHALGIDDLNQLLSELTVKNEKFKDRYLQDSGGCFSLTVTNKTNGTSDKILCFSGQSFKGLNESINKIVQSERFKNSVVIKKSLKVRYYICPDKYVTHAEAKQTHKDSEPRMFSCCERKTFAEYDWSEVKSYIMTVKYHPCELCQWSVNTHQKKHGGIINSGVRRPPLEKKARFDAIAEEIYNEIH